MAFVSFGLSLFCIGLERRRAHQVSCWLLRLRHLGVSQKESCVGSEKIKGVLSLKQREKKQGLKRASGECISIARVEGGLMWQTFQVRGLEKEGVKKDHFGMVSKP